MDDFYTRFGSQDIGCRHNNAIKGMLAMWRGSLRNPPFASNDYRGLLRLQRTPRGLKRYCPNQKGSESSAPSASCMGVYSVTVIPITQPDTPLIYLRDGDLYRIVEPPLPISNRHSSGSPLIHLRWFVIPVGLSHEGTLPAQVTFHVL